MARDSGALALHARIVLAAITVTGTLSRFIARFRIVVITHTLFGIFIPKRTPIGRAFHRRRAMFVGEIRLASASFAVASARAKTLPFRAAITILGTRLRSILARRT